MRPRHDRLSTKRPLMGPTHPPWLCSEQRTILGEEGGWKPGIATTLTRKDGENKKSALKRNWRHPEDTVFGKAIFKSTSIYNEVLCDLPVDDENRNNNMAIRSTEKSGVNVRDAIQKAVECTEDVLEVMEVDWVIGKFMGDCLEETNHINKSLSAFGGVGGVMAALASKSDHVPFRNRSLKNSLSGQVKSITFMHVAPEMSTRGETLNAFMLGARVLQITLRQCLILVYHDLKAKDGGRAEALEGGSNSLHITPTSTSFCFLLFKQQSPHHQSHHSRSWSCSYSHSGSSGVDLGGFGLHVLRELRKGMPTELFSGLLHSQSHGLEDADWISASELEQGAMPDFLKNPAQLYPREEGGLSGPTMKDLRMEMHARKSPGHREVNTRDADSYTLLHWAKRNNTWSNSVHRREPGGATW
ncbi:hypothetical protein BSKO_09097 [Bryopsis sp. KO-2023]|nr:hypothetical protein BSKO_09097 [Bryopsis sp. KO-2023]